MHGMQVMFIANPIQFGTGYFLRLTSDANVREDVNGSARRLSISIKDAETGKIANIWVVKDPTGRLRLELIDSWTAPRRYIDDLENK